MNTDNTKALAKKYNTTVAYIRDIAREAGYMVDYNPKRRCWFIDESATTVREFNERLAVFMDDMAYDN